jgi:hypothetical protein
LISWTCSSRLRICFRFFATSPAESGKATIVPSRAMATAQRITPRRGRAECSRRHRRARSPGTRLGRRWPIGAVFGGDSLTCLFLETPASGFVSTHPGDQRVTNVTAPVARPRCVPWRPRALDSAWDPSGTSNETRARCSPACRSPAGLCSIAGSRYRVASGGMCYPTLWLDFRNRALRDRNAGPRPRVAGEREPGAAASATAATNRL